MGRGCTYIGMQWPLGAWGVQVSAAQEEWRQVSETQPRGCEAWMESREKIMTESERRAPVQYQVCET